MDENRLPRPKYLWEANVEVAEKVKETVRQNIHEETNLPFISSRLTRCTMQLPARSDLPRGFDPQWQDVLFDRHVQMELEQARVVNWCRSIKTLLPLSVPGDGNCLLHAVSMAMWGVPDSTLMLRRLLYIALVEDSDCGQIQYRWKAEKGWLNVQMPSGGLSLSTGEWSSEWNLMKRLAEDVYTPSQPNVLAFESLEEIHIFVLANILRRPIIVLAEPVIRSVYGASLAPNNCGGIYLPLLLPPGDCEKTPIIIGFESNHFAPFIGTQDYSNQYVTAKDAVPLVTHNLEPLHIHFLSSSHEEQQAPSLLMNYLNLIEVNCIATESAQPILSASLQYLPIDPALDLMKEFCRVHPVSTTRPLAVASRESEIVQTNCTTTSCKYFGAPEFGGRCSRCFNEYTRQDVVQPTGGVCNHPEATGGPHGPAAIDVHVSLPHPRQTCKHVECVLEGKEDYKGYCRTCFINIPSTSTTRTPRHQAPLQGPPESLTSYTRALDDIKRCIGPNCGQLACNNYNGLCRRCFQTLALRNTDAAQRQSPSNDQASTGVKVQRSSPTIKAMGTTHPKYSTHTPPQALRQPVAPPSFNTKLCCAGNCDYYGDPNLEGYCSHCFPPYLTPRRTRDSNTTPYRQNDLQQSSEAPFGFIRR